MARGPYSPEEPAAEASGRVGVWMGTREA